MELFSGVIFAGTPLLARALGLSRVPPVSLTTFHIAIAVIFVCIMFLVLVIDLQHQIIPDQLNIALLVVAVISTFALNPSFTTGWVSSLVGMLILAGFFFLLAISIGGMGMGDVKMALGLGFFFGWRLTFVLAFISFLVGGVFAIAIGIRLIARRKYRPRVAIPFGPYLAVASVITLFAGDKILSWYLSFFKITPGG